ncbi:MAG: uL22 family ribosomal protein [Elusimicrobia bacterium]|nr:uL22 family ribosomal protein [Elusimicrobiota bacterium]
MDAKCHLKYQRYGRRKVAQLLDQVRGKSLYEAQYILAALPRRATDVVGKAIKSAGANLSVKLGRKLDLKQVWVTECFSDQGPMKFLRRVQPGPQGRAMPFKRKMCHISVVVSDTKKKSKESN